MTPYRVVYEAFLARITADEWTLEDDLHIVERDWEQLLDMAVFRFKYPRVSLAPTICQCHCDPDMPPCPPQEAFQGDLDDGEIQLLALYMKHEWIKRCIASWENIRMLYSSKDFSQANFLAKLVELEKNVALEVHKAEGIYDRSRHKRPADKFKKLAGKNV